MCVKQWPRKFVQALSIPIAPAVCPARIVARAFFMRYVCAMRVLALAVLLTLLLVIHPCLAMSRLIIPIPVVSGVQERYELVLAEKGKTAEDITDLKSPHADRHVAALVIIRQAMLAGGLPVDFQMIEVPNSAREKLLVQSGSAVISSQDLFSVAFPPGVFMSSPVIPQGSFVKGVYGLADNADLRKVQSLEQLRSFSAVSYSEWKVDWLTLNEFNLDRLASATTEEAMFKLVAHRNIDFTLCEFPPSEDLSVTVAGITLHPIPDLVVVLKGSRHFMVSKKHPDGPRVFEALQRGLAILHRDGRIARYLTDVGFYNSAVAEWKVLNP